jgi:hypothetical protein
MTQIHNGFTDEDMEKIKLMKFYAKHVMERAYVSGFLAGGCYTSWYHQEVPKDFDIFVTYNESKKLIMNHAKDVKRYRLSDGAYLNNAHIEHAVLDTETNIQYILVNYKHRKEIIDHFDAEHTAVSYDPLIDKLYVSASTLECIKKKILKPHKGNKIVHWREHKFKLKGFKIA